MRLIAPEEDLPKNNQYVLAYFPGRPWNDSDAKNNEHKWVVVKFVRGITVKQRALLHASDPRKWLYQAGDEFANNEKGYHWDVFGTGSFFGQEAEYWCELPVKLS